MIYSRWLLVLTLGSDRHYGGVKLHQAKPRIGGDDRRRHLHDDILHRVNIARDVCEALRLRAEHLQGQVELERGEVKDKQEAAIYVFTVSYIVGLKRY